MKIKQALLLTLAPVLVIAVSSCSFTKGKDVGERAVAQFHNQFNAGQYHEIYSQTDEGFRKITSEQDMVAALDAIHRKLGDVRNTNQTSWKVNTTTSGVAVSLTYDTEFAAGKATEQFVFYVNGDKAKLFSYDINSPLLDSK